MSPCEWPLYPADLRSGTKFILLRWCNCKCICLIVPRPHAPPSEKGGVWRRDYIMYEQRTYWIFMNHSMRICMTINEHACALCSGEVPVTLYSVGIQAERNAVDELWVYFSCIFRIIAVQMKSRNPLWNPKIRFKSRNPSRNPLWNPEIRFFEIQKFAWNPEIPREIHFEIQKSALKSWNPLWNPEIHFEIQKSTLKSRNPFWNPKSTWNPVDFEISYAETRRGGPLVPLWCSMLDNSLEILFL